MHHKTTSINKTLDALLRQDREDQGALGGLVDHLHHHYLVGLVDPMGKNVQY